MLLLSDAMRPFLIKRAVEKVWNILLYFNWAENFPVWVISLFVKCYRQYMIHGVMKPASLPATFIHGAHCYHALEQIRNLTLIMAAVFTGASKLEVVYGEGELCTAFSYKHT